jgi:glycosyltransferase involved in cell wall biosynthesis
MMKQAVRKYFRILFVGLLESKNKGLDILLKSFIDLKKSTDIPFELDVIGGGELLHFYMNNDEYLSENITFHGNKSSYFVHNLMNTSGMLVVPSLSESWGIVFQEALKNGCFICGYHDTVIELNNLCGLYIGEPFINNSTNCKELSELILKITSNEYFLDDEHRLKISESLNFSMDSFIDAHFDVYVK